MKAYHKCFTFKHFSGRCFCTSGLGYVTIDNYETKKDRQQDDIILEFKSNQSSGLIMYAKGLNNDFIHVGYKDSNVFMYHTDLGAGNQLASFRAVFN